MVPRPVLQSSSNLGSLVRSQLPPDGLAADGVWSEVRVLQNVSGSFGPQVFAYIEKSNWPVALVAPSKDLRMRATRAVIMVSRSMAMPMAWCSCGSSLKTVGVPQVAAKVGAQPVVLLPALKFRYSSRPPVAYVLLFVLGRVLKSL